jgi:type III restriction enzyme
MLLQKLNHRLGLWRSGNYKTKNFDVIKELLQFQRENGILKYLREPQFEAIETHFYLRIVENSPTVFELYKLYFTTKKELREALGIVKNQEILDLIENEENIFDKIINDLEFCKRNQLESVRETIQMQYSSYILALTMGTGKTNLIGVIIALEFCLALEYPDANFMKNALVFAPGTTILESLKEMLDIPFEKILPPRFYKKFLANVKVVYAKDGQKELQVEKNGHFHLIITNTEKIKLRAKNIEPGLDFERIEKLEHQNLEANHRLQAITSLPNLGIFSDEAHNTYGQDLHKALKRVRETIDYIADQTNLICVVNTTGTPYYKKQILKDVVNSYRLNQGIMDNILKSIRSVESYQMKSDSQDDHKTLLLKVMTDFTKTYKDVKTDIRCPAKIAFYFKNIEEANSSKEMINTFLLQNNLNWGVIINTQESTKADIDRFNRLNQPSSNDRVIILVGKGKEGWNCPSLFATALIRELTSSNNFILQASTRCLRQVPYNTIGATIYLDSKNCSVLEKELLETEGLTLNQVQNAKNNHITKKLTLLKVKIPTITIKKLVRKLEIDPKIQEFDYYKVFDSNVLDPDIIQTKYLFDTKKGILKQSSDIASELTNQSDYISNYQASYELCDNYQLEYNKIFELLNTKYPDGVIPISQYKSLLFNISKQSLKNYKIIEDVVQQSLMLIKPEGFLQDANGQYYIEIQISQDNLAKIKDKPDDQKFGYHYSPYNFDSTPEVNFFDEILNQINQKPENIEDLYFTGGLTNPSQTDFYFEYKKENGDYGKYYPDFVIKLKTGRVVIVEIKSARDKDNLIDGQNGLKAQSIKTLIDLNPDKMQYEYVSVENENIPTNIIELFKNIIQS